MATSKTIGRVSEMTLICPIRQGYVTGDGPPIRFVDRLRAMLAKVETLERPSGLDWIASVHFARWVIVDDGRKLLFTTNFDGSWEQYLRDFCMLVPRHVDAIWSNCIGYPGAANYPAFLEWVRKHQVETELFYAALPEHTVRDIVWMAKLKAAFARFEAVAGTTDLAAWPPALRDAWLALQGDLDRADLTVIRAEAA